MGYEAVIDKVSGDLLRAGFTAMNDDAFDGVNEEVKVAQDANYPLKVKGRAAMDPADDVTYWHRWNGTAWVLVNV